MKGSSENLTFRFDAPANKLCSAEIDSKRISPDCYTVRAGSTILALKPAFLDTLDLGGHVVTAFYTDGGRATASFAVSEKASAQEDSKQKANDERKASDIGKHDEAANGGNNEPSTLDPRPYRRFDAPDSRSISFNRNPGSCCRGLFHEKICAG